MENGIELKVENRTAILTISREKYLNALNEETIQALSSHLEALENDKNVRCIIITGAGEKAFVAGADIKEFVNFDQDQGKALSENGQKLLFDKIDKLSKPVIAAVNGFALGGGLELALACHIRVASVNAKCGLPEVKLGLIPGYGGTQRLVQIAGKGNALELMLTGEMIDAKRAERLGIFNHVVEQDKLLDLAKKIALSVGQNSSSAVMAVLKSVSFGTDIQVALQKEIQLFGECFGTEDFKEGTAAFLEKRKANFK